jgi:hypothetical protein
MHKSCCGCTKCQAMRNRAFKIERFGAMPAREPLLSEAEEMELAMELLGVSNEDEMEQFLGKMFRGIGRGLKKVGRFVSRKVFPVLGKAFKGLAPMLGGALGSLIPIPGVGTALGTALGSAVSKALEMELGEFESEEAELETARRFVRIAAATAQQASAAPPDANPESAVRNALLAAVRAHVPAFAANEAELMAEAEAEMGYEGEYESEGEYEGEGEYEQEYEGEAGSAPSAGFSGRWTRRGRHIVLHGV